MKKFLIAAIAFLGISAATFAQPTAAAAKDTSRHASVKAKHPKAAKTNATSTTAATKAATATTATAGTAATAHTKKDGTADKRYKENKTGTKPAHVKKDGTADKRFKENKKQ